MIEALIGLLSVGAYIGAAVALIAWARRTSNQPDRGTPPQDTPPWLSALGSACQLAGPWWMHAGPRHHVASEERGGTR